MWIPLRPFVTGACPTRAGAGSKRSPSLFLSSSLRSSSSRGENPTNVFEGMLFRLRVGGGCCCCCCRCCRRPEDLGGKTSRAALASDYRFERTRRGDFLLRRGLKVEPYVGTIVYVDPSTTFIRMRVGKEKLKLLSIDRRLLPSSLALELLEGRR